MHSLHAVTTILVVIVALIHIALTPLYFEALTPRTMWYVAQGLMVLFLGFLNIAARRSGAPAAGLWRLTAAANALASIFVLVYAVADRAAPTYLVVALILVLTASFFLSRTIASRPRG